MSRGRTPSSRPTPCSPAPSPSPRGKAPEEDSRRTASNGGRSESVPAQPSSGSLGASNRSYSEEQERGAKKILQLAQKSHYEVRPPPELLD